MNSLNNILNMINKFFGLDYIHSAMISENIGAFVSSVIIWLIHLTFLGLILMNIASIGLVVIFFVLWLVVAYMFRKMISKLL